LSNAQGALRRTLFQVHQEDRITEDSEELCQEGIELVQECTEGTISSSERRSVTEERHSTELLNTLFFSARCASSRRMPVGCKKFSSQENFLNLSYSKS
jgi:hypothetical protein